MTACTCKHIDRWHTLLGCAWCDCPALTAAPTGPAWRGTILESCIRDVALGRIASHSNVTAEMVDEWRRLNPGPAAPTGPEPRTDAAVER